MYINLTKMPFPNIAELFNTTSWPVISRRCNVDRIGLTVWFSSRFESYFVPVAELRVQDIIAAVIFTRHDRIGSKYRIEK